MPIKVIVPRVALRAFVAKHGTQRAAASALGVSQQFLSDMLVGHREVSRPVLAQLGLERVVVQKRKAS